MPDLGTVIVTGALALPAAAAAGSDYVVSLHVPTTPETCEQRILQVASDYDLTVRVVYTSALCGFATPLTRPELRRLEADPRVASVSADRPFEVS